MTTPPVLLPPDKAVIAALEPFAGVTLENICVPETPEAIAEALAELRAVRLLGFDTESRPTFRKGEVSDGPHVVQFATPLKTYVFQTRHKEGLAAVAEILESGTIVKVGFGLGNDTSQLAFKFGIQPQALLDLDRSFRKLGYRNSVGAKSAIAILFQRRFVKSKSLSTSNWSVQKLTDRQILYAANDAYAALVVFEAMEAGMP